MYPAAADATEDALAGTRRLASDATGDEAVLPTDLVGGEVVTDLSPWLDTVIAGQRFDATVLLSSHFTTVEAAPIVELAFEGVGSSVLTPWQLTPAARLTYSLPSVSQPELIELALGHDLASGALDACDCYELVQE